MMTWRRGTAHPDAEDAPHRGAARTLVHSLEKKPPHVVPGTAVFLTSDPEFAPTALLHNLKHNKVLHEHNVILTIIFADTPRVPQSERVTHHAGVRPLQPRVAANSASWKSRTCRRRSRSRASTAGPSTSCRRRSSCRGARIKAAAHSGMPHWQDQLFIGLAKSATDATDFFQIPTGRVVEVGTQVTV